MADDPAALGNRELPLADRCRLAFVAGALEEWREAPGRPMTAEELERVLRRCPGDDPP